MNLFSIIKKNLRYFQLSADTVPQGLASESIRLRVMRPNHGWRNGDRDNGFVLLELLISILISGFITIGLFTSFTQLRKAMSAADTIASVHQRALQVYQQFDRDLSGAFKPTNAKKEEEKETVQPGQKPAKQGQDAPKQEKPLTHIFYGANKDAQFEVLTCITANPLNIYWSGDRAGFAKPRMARIVYRLIKEKGEPISYRLVRQEAYNPLEWSSFAPAAAQPVRQLELITGIKSCAVSYTAAAEKKSDESAKGETKKKKKKEYEYKETKEWKLSNKESEKKSGHTSQEKKEKPKELPDFVTMKLVLWDDVKVREFSFEFTWAVGRALFGDFEADTDEEERVKKKDEQMPQSREEAKKHFGETMRKIQALQEKEAALMRNSGMRAPMMAHSGAPRQLRGVAVQPTEFPGIVRVSDAASSNNRSMHAPQESSAGELSVSLNSGHPGPEYDMSWVQDMPPEFQEQLYAHYDDMLAVPMDVRGM